MYGSILRMFQPTRTTSYFTPLAVATGYPTPSLAAKEAEPTSAITITYDYEVNWTQGEWAGTTSSGWFSYNNSTPQPSLEAFELTLGGSCPLVVRDYTSDQSPLYWDGVGLSIRECRRIPAHLLYTRSGLFGFGRVGYYLGFGETASRCLMNVYSSDNYTYMGGGLLTYSRR